MIRVYDAIILLILMISVNLTAQKASNCVETLQRYEYNFSLEADFKKVTRSTEINLKELGGTCEFYKRLFRGANISEGSIIEESPCDIRHLPYTYKTIVDLFGNSTITVFYEFYSEFRVAEINYSMLTAKLFNADQTLCRQTYLLLRSTPKGYKFVDLRRYRNINQWNDIFCFTDLYQFTNPTTLALGSIKDKSGDIALSISKILHDSVVDLVSAKPCQYNDSKEGEFCLATNYVDDYLIISRSYYYNDTIRKAEIDRSDDQYDSDLCSKLWRFMVSNEARTLSPIYQTPAHLPIFTYTRLKTAGQDPAFKSHYLRKNFATPLPNSYGLSLTGVQLDAYLNNEFAGHKALIFIDTPEGKCIFTDFDSYPNLRRQIKARLAYKPEALDCLATRPYQEMTTDVERILWKAARRVGESQFLFDYLTDFIEENGGLYKSYVYNEVDIIEAGEYWY